MATSVAAAKAPMTREEKKVIFASSLGTVFEWYDFYLYGSLAAIIGAQFFSGLDPTSAYIFALLAFAEQGRDGQAEVVDDVLAGLREFDFRSENALMCFPRIQAFDRLRARGVARCHVDLAVVNLAVARRQVQGLSP